jgi:hypothetical protein
MLHWIHDLNEPLEPGLYQVAHIGVIEVTAADIRAARSTGGNLRFAVRPADDFDPDRPLVYRLHPSEPA